MHKLSIVHGDLKPVNVLVTDSGTAKLCDFGHSRYIDGSNHNNQLATSDASSNFQATTRYMCPEFFRSKRAKPTVFSDMWAFGCLALEILSQLQPYHTIRCEFDIPSAIRIGVTPSVKPEYPNAAGCLNDVLWGVVELCWSIDPALRPSSNVMLESIHNLMEEGKINPFAATPEHSGLSMDDELILLPSMKDFANESSNLRRELVLGGKSVDIWAYYDHRDQHHATSGGRVAQYVVKVPCVGYESRSANHLFDNALRQVIKERHSLRHINLVKILGIDSGCGRHLGVVLEYCSQGSFVLYKNKMQQDEELYRKYMVHILSGLQYLHTQISPISHGDLTPSNILVDAGGNLKLTSISLTRISLSLPSEEQGILFEGGINSARYMSPELLRDEACPTPQSDMWAFGNVAFWIHSGLIPYPEHKYEIAVIAQLNQGTPPNGSSQLEKLETLGGISIPEDILWLTNGTWASIMRCWNTDVRNRLTATQFLRELKIQSNMSEISGAAARWGISGVTDLTGRIKRSETRSYGPTLGWSQGIWRGAYDGRGNRVTHITLWCWRTTLSQGFFRSNIDTSAGSSPTVVDPSADRSQSKLYN
ncbi:hypothetical protein FRC09_015988 [Ceratobasidium sp. 395]|nr:hypothetical protein FRC09_015988 [Ceratobasidium sp. 395]